MWQFAKKVSAAEAQLRRLESRQRKVTKETTKVQTVAEKMGLGSWRDIDPGHLVKASLGEACRKLEFPIMDGTGEEIVTINGSSCDISRARRSERRRRKFGKGGISERSSQRRR